ncbi:hypothetical protein [Marinibacterium profundimaris]|uniref:CYTH domain-containing protein n=1 Tax=Marinibacterium profundimaris TaxID=1679460 RepID=A0A225NBR1_9RHOB|nr:hypothetical protein [Marinibacterium profundimaris]OWU68096.1 hypothetical protein ATO3_24670 [Marinibacterium profundimaris]
MGRLEYRIFGKDLGDKRRSLQREAARSGQDRREDVYFLGPSIDRIFKLRDGEELDFKRLVGREDRFERWDPVGLIELPASGAAFPEAFVGASGMPDLDATRLYGPVEIRKAFERGGAREARVCKTRQRYDVGHCMAEMTELRTSDGAVTLSLAIEGDDLAALSQLRDRLGIVECQNMSYPRWLTDMAT